MSTRATIRFSDEFDTEFYVYRHSDGYPDSILPDIGEALAKAERRWSGSGCGILVSFFIGLHFRENERLPSYELTSAFHGDESYRYYVEWDDKRKKWCVRLS